MTRYDCKGEDKDADVVFAVDLSGSFGDLLSDLGAPFLSDLDADLAARGVDDAAYGVTSYIDYPFDPLWRRRGFHLQHEPAGHPGCCNRTGRTG